jgi:hypothetical protein
VRTMSKNSTFCCFIKSFSIYILLSDQRATPQSKSRLREFASSSKVSKCKTVETILKSCS